MAERGVFPSPSDLQLPRRPGWTPMLKPRWDTGLVLPWKVSLAARASCAVVKPAPCAGECAPHDPKQLEQQ